MNHLRLRVNRLFKHVPEVLVLTIAALMHLRKPLIHPTTLCANVLGKTNSI